MPRKPVAPPADPLADLRPDDDTPNVPAVVSDAQPNDDTEEPFVLDALDAAWHEDAQTRIVAAWHRDRTAQGFAHKGGVCGCRFLARVALVAAVGEPVALPDDVEDEPDGDGA